MTLHNFMHFWRNFGTCRLYRTQFNYQDSDHTDSDHPDLVPFGFVVLFCLEERLVIERSRVRLNCGCSVHQNFSHSPEYPQLTNRPIPLQFLSLNRLAWIVRKDHRLKTRMWWQGKIFTALSNCFVPLKMMNRKNILVARETQGNSGTFPLWRPSELYDDRTLWKPNFMTVHCPLWRPNFMTTYFHDDQTVMTT